MPEMLERLRGTPHLKKALITNGTLIGKRISPKLLQGFSFLLISIVSTELEIYQQTMRGAASDPSTLEHVLRLPTLFGESRPDLNACVVVGRTNDQHLDKVATDLIDRGFDFVYFKAAYNYEALGEKLLQRQREQIRETAFLLPPRVAQRTNLSTFLQDCDAKEAQRVGKRKRCINLQYQLNATIDALGDIYLCGPDVGIPTHSLGNIQTSQSTQPLKSLHSSQRLQRMHKIYCAGQCGRCRFKRYNDLVAEAEQTQSPVPAYEEFEHPDFV
jgi:radical SAM protein with 4Fe4S-binding SPASM domain